jgi:hypothetical protein
MAISMIDPGTFQNNNSKASTCNDMIVHKVALAGLKPSRLQPKSRTRLSRVEQLAASMAEFGQIHPIQVNLRTGRIVTGHTRYAAAVLLGWTHINVVYVDVDPKQELARFKEEGFGGGRSEPISCTQFLEMLDTGLMVKSDLPAKQQRNYDDANSVWGEGWIKYLAEHHMPMSAAGSVIKLHGVLYGLDREGLSPLGKLGAWCVDYSAVGPKGWVYAAIKMGRIKTKEAKQLNAAVRRNRPYRIE